MYPVNNSIRLYADFHIKWNLKFIFGKACAFDENFQVWANIYFIKQRFLFILI